MKHIQGYEGLNLQTFMLRTGEWHSGMVWLSCAAPPWGAVAVGGAVRLKKGGGR